MYLTDLTFIEDGLTDILPGGLIHFTKRRTVAHVIRYANLVYISHHSNRLIFL